MIQKTRNNRISYLKSAGLSEDGIQRILKLKPSLYTIIRMKSSLNYLLERDFNNPLKLIEKFPSIFGYSFDNIDSKLKYFNRVFNIYTISFTPQELLENKPTLIGTKLEKIQLLTRVLCEVCNSLPKTLNKREYNLFLFKLEDVLIAFIRYYEDNKERDFWEYLKKVKNEKIPKTDAQKQIKKELPYIFNYEKNLYIGARMEKIYNKAYNTK
jgi:hypothetical protein